MTELRKLRIFLCHASQDKPVVRDLYRRLRSEAWIEPWLDEEKLLPGQDWDMEIEKAVESADAVVVCLSSTSVSKEGYIQRELRFALDIALEKPEGAIFVIPLRLDDCELPRRLRSWQYVDFFPEDHRQRAYQKLLQSLQLRSKGARPETSAPEVQTSIPPDPSMNTFMAPASTEKTGDSISSIGEAESRGGVLEVGGTISLILYLLLTSFELFASTGNAATYLMAASALVGGLFLIYRRWIPKLSLFKYSLVVYLLGYGLNDYFYSDENQIISIFIVVSALVCTGLLAMSFRSPKKTANYSAVFLAAFLFFYSASAVMNSFTSAPPAIIGLVLSVITSILLFMDL